MFDELELEDIELAKIDLDASNPRIVKQEKLNSQDAILNYFFEHEKLLDFIHRFAAEGYNPAAERPYLIKKGGGRYTVVEGNTRIATFKILTGLLKPPKKFAAGLPTANDQLKAKLKTIPCAIAPSRDQLLPIMARSHFGRGDKSSWSYLGSRKALYDEWAEGKSIKSLSQAFAVQEVSIRDFILEYVLYLETLKLDWTEDEIALLVSPNLKFNPPIRFLQSSGHRDSMGITYDKENIAIVFDGEESKHRLKHLVKKLVLDSGNGFSATSSFESVFASYSTPPKQDVSSPEPGKDSTSTEEGSPDAASASSSPKAQPPAPLPNTKLFDVAPKIPDPLVIKLLGEAKNLSTTKYPASSTFLLRNIVESTLKYIIHEQQANKSGKQLDLEGSINLCISPTVNLTKDDKKILSEFKKHFLNYINLGAHGNIIPSTPILMSARDLIGPFILRNIK